MKHCIAEATMGGDYDIFSNVAPAHLDGEVGHGAEQTIVIRPDGIGDHPTAPRLNPSFSLAHGYYGLTLSYCGRWEESALAAERAIRLSPRDPFLAAYYGIAGYAQFVGRNYDEAMRLARQGIRERADFAGAHRVLTAAAAMAGQADAAKAALLELCRGQPNISLAWIAEQIPTKQDAERGHYLEALSRAGLD